MDTYRYVPRERRESPAARETAGGSRSAGRAARPATRPSPRPSPRPATGCYGFPGSSRRPIRSGGRPVTPAYMIRPLTTSRLSIALRRKNRDAPAAGAVRTPGAGSGTEAPAEAVTATAAGDKAKLARAYGKLPLSVLLQQRHQSGGQLREHLAHKKMPGFHAKTTAELREHAPAQTKRPGLQPPARPGSRHPQPGSHNTPVPRGPQASSASTETRA